MGTYCLSPQVTYKDNLGNTKITNTRTVEVHVGSAPIMMGIDKSENRQRPTFKSESADAIYHFLLKAREQDYLQRKMPARKDRVGEPSWTSCMALMCLDTAFMAQRNGGQAIAELQRAGLVEVRSV